MNLNKIAKKVHKIAPSVKVEECRGCVRLTGELDSWDAIYRCGVAAVSKKFLGVLNDIRLKGFREEMKVPSLRDGALEGRTPDVMIIGGGIMGCSLARELSRLDIDVLMVDKANDVATGASSRNDGCIHPGIDLHKGQLKLHYVLRGNAMYSKLCEELGCDFERWAQTFMFSTKWERYIIAPLMLLKGKLLGVPDMSFKSPAEMKKIEPHPPKWLTGAVYMASAGVVSPYKVTIALAENAAENGAQISLNTVVEGMDVRDGVVTAVHTNRGTVRPKIVVNAAGAYSDVIAEMAGDRTFTIHPRKGTDLILDKKKAYYAVSSFARSYFAPLPKEAQEQTHAAVGHTKGGGVMRTVDGNILVGPNAVEQPYREDTSTNLDDVMAIIRKQKVAADELSTADIITYFAGVRAATYEEDFVVRKGIFTKNVIETAGIQSPGITAAPAIACDVRAWVKEMLGAKDRKDFNPVRKHTPKLVDLTEAEREEFVKRNPAYGEIVCRCEEVSKGEIVDALESPLKVCTVDGIKRRVRPGMGRCQGGFCSPLVIKIIAEHEGIAPEDVLKGDEGSVILYGDTKKAAEGKE